MCGNARMPEDWKLARGPGGEKLPPGNVGNPTLFAVFTELAKLVRIEANWGHPQVSPTKGHPVRVLIADDQALFREALAALLRERGGIEISGQATNGQEAIRLAMELKPDLILMDVTMPVINGLEAARRLATVLPGTPIVIVTMHQNRELIQTAREIGVRGYVSKSEVNERLFDAIHTVLNGGMCFSDGVPGEGRSPKTQG